MGGAHAVIVGRSEIVGKPQAHLLLEQNCTVTICHSRTRDLPSITRQADILVAAVGRPEMLTAEHVRDGAVVIDVGINRLEKGLVGDVDFASVAPKARLITPVPGRRRADDDRDAAAQLHRRGRAGRGLSAAAEPRNAEGPPHRSGGPSRVPGRRTRSRKGKRRKKYVLADAGDETGNPVDATHDGARERRGAHQNADTDDAEHHRVLGHRLSAMRTFPAGAA